MSFLVERDLAKAALAYEGPPPLPAFPPVAARVRAARQALGLSVDELAARVGLPTSRYVEFELRDSEVFASIDLAALPGFADALGLPVFTLLFGERPLRSIRVITYPDVAHAIERLVNERRATIEALSGTVGRDIHPVVEDPGRLDGFNVKGLFDLCQAVGLDWVGVLAAMDM